MSKQSITVSDTNDKKTSITSITSITPVIKDSTDKVIKSDDKATVTENKKDSSPNDKIQNTNKPVKEPKDLSVSDAIHTNGTETNSETATSDNEESSVESESVDGHSGGSKTSTYKKTIIDLHHKWNKYKYKHEMQRRRIKEVLKKHDQMELYDEIMGNN